MTDNIKKQEVKDFLINHFGCKTFFGFDCLELIVKRGDVKLDEILEHKIIELKTEDYKNIFHIAHRSESKLRVKDTAKIVTSYEIIRGLRKQDYKELLNEIISNRKWDVLEILLSKGKDPEGKPVTNYFLDNIDGEVLLDEVIENGDVIPNDVFSKIMDEMKDATEGIFRDKLTEALNAMKDHEFIDLCAKSINSTLNLIINLAHEKFIKTLFNIGNGECEKDLKNIIDRITIGNDAFLDFMLQTHIVTKGGVVESLQISFIPDFIRKCADEAIEEGSKLKDLELVSILFDKLSGDKLESLLDGVLFTEFLNKFFNIENLKNPEFDKIAEKIVMNIDNSIFKKLYDNAESNKFEDFLSKYFEKHNTEQLIKYSDKNYAKKGYDAIFKYLVDNKFNLNDKAKKIDVEEALLLGKTINTILLQGCVNQDKIVEIFAKSEYLVILKGEDDYIDGLFTTMGILAGFKSYANTKSLLSIKNHIDQVIGDQELSKTINKALDQAEETVDKNQPILQLTGGNSIDIQDIYKFKPLLSLLNSLQNSKGVLECQTKLNQKEEEFNNCTQDLKEANAKISVYAALPHSPTVDTKGFIYVESGNSFISSISMLCGGAGIGTLISALAMKMSVQGTGQSAAKDSALGTASTLIIIGTVGSVICLPMAAYGYVSSSTKGSTTKVDDDQEKQPVVNSKNEEQYISETHQPSSIKSDNSAESSNLPSTSDDLIGTSSEMQQNEQHQHHADEL
jgi:hypothetical protein